MKWVSPITECKQSWMIMLIVQFVVNDWVRPPWIQSRQYLRARLRPNVKKGRDARRECVGEGVREKQKQECAHKEYTEREDFLFWSLRCCCCRCCCCCCCKCSRLYKFSNECGRDEMLRWDLHLNRIHSIHLCFANHSTHTHTPVSFHLFGLDKKCQFSMFTLDVIFCARCRQDADFA